MTQAVSVPAGLRVSLVTGGLKLGGSTTFLCNFGGELVKRGIPVEVASFEKANPLASDFNRLNVPVFCEDDARNIFEDRLQSILERIRDFKPTVVIATLSAQSFEVLRYVPSGILRIGMGQSDDTPVYRMMSRYISVIDLLTVVSAGMLTKMQTMPEFRGLAVKYLPLGVPMPAGGTERQFSEPLRILYFGRLEREQKRVQLFPQILAGLKQSGIPFHWTIAGDGPELPWLREQMSGNAPLQTVSLPGKVAYADVPELLRKHDIFLLASDYEGLPLSLLEAMGAGLVAIVSDLPSGIRELVNDQTGRRVQLDNIDAYAKAIVSLHQDRDKLKQLSRNAAERVRSEFSVEAMTDRWLNEFPKTYDIADWPRRWSISKPLVSNDWLRFSLPARIARRAALKFSKR